LGILTAGFLAARAGNSAEKCRAVLTVSSIDG
jgi:hypothetical protein